jgi:hypothetical protein
MGIGASSSIDIAMQEPPAFEQPHVRLPEYKSRVLILPDLVEPDELDEFLRDEVKQECVQFGEVLNCVVHQVAGESVKVFVEFKE